MHVSSEPVEVSIKSVLSDAAAAAGQLFMPIDTSGDEGGRVYQFGKLKVRVDRGITFVSKSGKKGKWRPMPLRMLAGE